MTGSWRKLHNEVLHNFSSSSTIIRMVKSRRTRWPGHVECMRVGETCKIWVLMTQGRRTIGRHEQIRVSIKTYLREIGCEVLVWIQGVPDRDWSQAFVNTYMFHKRG